MDLPVFFIGNNSSTKIITLSEETSKHVVQVLRMKAAEQLQLTDGAGSLLTAEIIDANKKNSTVKIIENKFIPKRKQEVSIAISLLKNSSRFEWFLEKVTEIGVTEIIPLLCERTEKQHFRYERMNQIVISAMMQSKQVWLPVLQQPTEITTVISSSDKDTKLIAHCEDEMKTPLVSLRKGNDTQILIGPEGDFSRHEISLALESNYQPVTLGETRLRSETAGVVAATLLCV